MDNLIINAENIRGMNKDKKRINYFAYLKGKKERDFTVVTETKCHEIENAEKWGRQWSTDERDSYWSINSEGGASKGVTILVHPKFKKRDAQIIHTDIDSCGRWVKIVVLIGDSIYRILGIYAPNDGKERMQFFKSLEKVIDDKIDAENLVGGDYNCTMNSKLDRLNCISDSNDKGQNELHYLKRSNDLQDIWRIRNPNTKGFSWFGQNKSSRIDFWLTSASLNGQISEIDMSHSNFSDHHSVKISVRTNSIKQGRGVWKMNNSYLSNPEFRDEITTVWQNWQNEKDDFDDITQWWDLGKMKIKETARNFAKEQSILRKSKEDELKEEITSLSNSNSNPERLIALKNEYDKLINDQCEGARIRSRLQWWEEGEKSTKFFHGLEKRNGKNKAWDKILDENNRLIFGTSNIQKRQVRFYKKLFQSEPVKHDQSFFMENPTRTLSKNDQENLERDISKEDILNAIKKCLVIKVLGRMG